MSLLEVCCFSAESAIIAAKAGADRIELCDGQHQGGTTPPREWVEQVKAAIGIPVFVMVRPRGGSFEYSADEFEAMCTSIDQLKDIVDGFVFGLLSADHTVDVAKTAELVGRASPLPCTFHKAFDQTPDLLQALEELVDAGCHCVLTSGGAPTALSGVEVLKQLVAAAGDRISVLIGGGVRLHSLAQIRASFDANAFHSSALFEGSALPDAEHITDMKRVLGSSGG